MNRRFRRTIHKCFNVQKSSLGCGVEPTLNAQLFQACKELIDDAKMCCADLVFKEVCLEILSRASHVLTNTQFKQLAAYATERMKEKIPFEVQEELAMHR